MAQRGARAYRLAKFLRRHKTAALADWTLNSRREGSVVDETASRSYGPSAIAEANEHYDNRNWTPIVQPGHRRPGH
jgi:hypothetical protein